MTEISQYTQAEPEASYFLAYKMTAQSAVKRHPKVNAHSAWNYSASKRSKSSAYKWCNAL